MSWRIKLWMVTPRYPPFVGGVENHVYQVAQRLARSQFDVTVLTTDPSGTLAPQEQDNGVIIQRVRAYPAQRDYYFAPDLYRAITHAQCDLIHLQSYHTFVAPITLFAANRARIPYVVTFHGGGHSSSWRNSIRDLQRQLLRPGLARAERLIVIAEFEKAMFRKMGLPEQKFILIPNGSDLPNLSNVPQEPGLIISIGRLERYKGHQRVIAAMPLVIQQNPAAHLLIIGAGPYKNDLAHLASELKISDRVEMREIPATDRMAMARTLASAALVTLLSEYETHPISVIEAVTLGRSALVADTSGLRELAERGLARAIPLASSPSEIANAILDQLAHPLIPPAIQLPTWDECAARLAMLYREILEQRSSAS